MKWSSPRLLNAQVHSVLQNSKPFKISSLCSLQDYSIPSHAATTTLDLFTQEMKYLYDNGFKVFLLNQLGYDPNSNVFYRKRYVDNGHLIGSL